MKTTVKGLLTGAAVAAFLTGAPVLADETTTPGYKNMDLAQSKTTQGKTTGNTAAAPA